MSFEVLILAYNCADTLPRALNSLVQQTSQNFIVSIFDDGSTQDIKAVIKEFESKLHINYYRYSKNVGCALNRQRALKQVSQDYFLFLDADDSLAPTAIEAVQKLILEKSPDIIVTPICLYQNNQISTIQFFMDNCGGRIYKSSYIKKNKIRMSKKIKYSEDGYLNFLAIELTDNICIVNTPIYLYIDTETSVTHTSEFIANRTVDTFRCAYWSLKDVLKYKAFSKLKNQHVLEKMTNFYDKINLECSEKEKKKCVNYLKKIKRITIKNA